MADFIDFKYSTTVSYNLSNFLIGLSWTFRPLIQMCMCIEQYLAVIHPVIFLRCKGFQYRIASAAAAWLVAVGNSSRLVSIKRNFFRDHVYFLFFCIAVITTSFCSVSVLCALVRPGPGDRINVRNNKTDRGRAVENQQKEGLQNHISYFSVYPSLLFSSCSNLFHVHSWYSQYTILFMWSCPTFSVHHCNYCIYFTTIQNA